MGMTKREYLASIGIKTGTRGRFSPEATKALAEAPAGSFDEVVKAEPKEKRESSNKAPKAEKPTGNYEPKAVRKWANENGHNLPARGKLPHAVIAAYMGAHTAEEVAADIVNPDAAYDHVEPFRRGIRYEGEYQGKRFEVGGANTCFNHKHSGMNVGLDYCPSSEPHEVMVGTGRAMVTPVTHKGN